MKKILLGSVALMAAMSFSGSPAMALGTDASCVVAGATGSIEPSVQWVGGEGDFTFAGTVACQVFGAPLIGTLSAAGHFVNAVCGTGVATGTAEIPGYGSKAFTIQFVAGVGVVIVDGLPSGAVQLIPTGPDTSGAPLTNCVEEFTVVGAFSV
jgi:hypothetical protein